MSKKNSEPVERRFERRLLEIIATDDEILEVREFLKAMDQELLIGLEYSIVPRDFKEEVLDEDIRLDLDADDRKFLKTMYIHFV